MSRILIGSSNVYRHYRYTAFPTFGEHSMLRCVDLETFAAQMVNLEPSETEIIVAVMENFIDGATSKSKEGEERDGAVERIVKAYLAEVKNAAKKNPGSKFVLVDPILCPKLQWYDDGLDAIKALHKDEIANMGLLNVSRVDVISRASQTFEEDGVHLTATSGKIYVEGILRAAKKSFKAEYVDLGDEDSADGKTAGGDVEAHLRKLENEMEERRWNDNLLFARTREELDLASNKTKEDRVIITGLSSKKPQPKDWEGKKKWIREIVMEALKWINPDFKGEIGFINQGKNNGRDIPMVEVKLGSVEEATNIRKAFAEKRKEGDGKSVGRLYVSNSVSLSTRVRIDILKAMAKKLSNNKEAAHVAAYSSRPILHVKAQWAGKDQTTRAFTFIDAVIKYGGILNRVDLDEAYRRAGSAFRGQMEQHFVVLREQGNHSARPDPNPKANPHQRKRQIESEPGGSGESSKAKK
jgi:hypothetical protein